jgi:hypothetical protein
MAQTGTEKKKILLSFFWKIVDNYLKTKCKEWLEEMGDSETSVKSEFIYNFHLTLPMYLKEEDYYRSTC